MAGRGLCLSLDKKMGASRPSKESATYLVGFADEGEIEGAVHAPSGRCLLGFCSAWVFLDPPGDFPVVLTCTHSMQCKMQCKVKIF